MGFSEEGKKEGKGEAAAEIGEPVFEGNKMKISFTIFPWFLQSSDFEKKVWKAAAKIPYGTTISYAGLAKKIGKPGSARAVGNALGKNPCPIVIPCHRVIKTDGTLGGFSGGRGWKKKLLNLEALK